MSKCPVKVGRGLHASRKLSPKVCLAAALIIAVLAASCFVLFSETDDSSADPPATSGSCGTNATWSYADGTLTISKPLSVGSLTKTLLVLKSSRMSA